MKRNSVERQRRAATTVFRREKTPKPAGGSHGVISLRPGDPVKTGFQSQSEALGKARVRICRAILSRGRAAALISSNSAIEASQSGAEDNGTATTAPSQTTANASRGRPGGKISFVNANDGPAGHDYPEKAFTVIPPGGLRRPRILRFE
jgi:hypothetical protein